MFKNPGLAFDLLGLLVVRKIISFGKQLDARQYVLFAPGRKLGVVQGVVKGVAFLFFLFFLAILGIAYPRLRA